MSALCPFFGGGGTINTNTLHYHQVAKKVRELMADHENMNTLHESHDLFKREQDEQLVQWMNR